MITMTITPAYGRDYKTAKAAKADYHTNKDFIVADFHSPWDGKPVNKEQLTDERHVIIRFNNLRKVTAI